MLPEHTGFCQIYIYRYIPLLLLYLILSISETIENCGFKEWGVQLIWMGKYGLKTSPLLLGFEHLLKMAISALKICHPKVSSKSSICIFGCWECSVIGFLIRSSHIYPSMYPNMNVSLFHEKKGGGGYTIVIYKIHAFIITFFKNRFIY